MDPTARRNLLITGPNPGNRLDFVVSLEGTVVSGAGANPLTVVLRYVPDKSVLEDGAFATYLGQFESASGEKLEAIGVTILEDINNEVVPRWVQVSVAKGGDTEAGSERHGVLLEDRQPRWDNQPLLSRLQQY